MTLFSQRPAASAIGLAALFVVFFAGCNEDSPVQSDDSNSPGNGKIYATRKTGSSTDLVWLNRDGSEQQVLRRGAEIISPPQAGKFLMETEARELILTDLEGNTIRTIPTRANVAMAVLSPDGNTICYAYWDYLNTERQIYTIHTVRADGTGDVLLTTQGGWENRVAFSPDSKRIAFYLDEDEESDSDKLYTINTDGTDLRLVTDNAARIGDRFGRVTWSPTGDRILFSRGHGDRPEIWSIKPDGSDERQMTGTDVAMGLFPIFSPDGTMIAFSGARSEDGQGADLWIMNSDGTNKRKLTDTPGRNDMEAFPHWSPDGKSILCVSFAMPEYGEPTMGKVKTVDVATGATTFVIETPDIREAFWGLK